MSASKEYMEPELEIEYIKRIQQKDELALAVIVRYYQGSVYSMVLNIVKNEDDAMELAQDVFLKVFEKAGSFQFNSKFSTWLYTVTYNTCMSFLRKKKIKWSTLEEGMESVIVPDNFNVSAIAEQERKKYIHMALEGMSDQQKLLVQLYYLEELSVKEIVEITKLGTSSIKTGLLRARQSLYKQLSLHLNDEVNSLL